MSGPPDTLVSLETLADAHALLRGLFEHSPVPYAIYSCEGHYLLSNPAYRRMFGMAPPPGYSLFEDEHVAALGLLSTVQRALAGEVVDTEVFWYDPNALSHVEVRGANRVAIACTAFPLRALHGEVSQLAIAYRDVTAELTAREEAEALAKQLRSALDLFEVEHQNLQRSDAELRSTLRELEQAVRVRDDFLSIAGHEVRTPLTALLLNLQTLTRSAQSDPEFAVQPKLQARLQKTLENAERLQQLTEELLDVTRIAAGRLRLSSESLDLVGLVRSVIARLSEQALKAGSPVRAAMRGTLCGSWDRIRLEQLVTNLLTNALKYGAGKPIDVLLEQDGDSAVLTVRDHGIGVSHEDQARIFERFERAVSSRHYGGLGLGLWIARQVVEASGGTIEVQSVLGEGACFTVRLPTTRGACASDAG